MISDVSTENRGVLKRGRFLPFRLFWTIALLQIFKGKGNTREGKGEIKAKVLIYPPPHKKIYAPKSVFRGKN